MADCNYNCQSCSKSDCAERKIEKLKPNSNTTIKHCFAVISGKGGVGKSLVTSLLASSMNKKGYNVAILDADITGPSIPQAFGLKDKMAQSDEDAIYPVISRHGIRIMSANLLLPNDEDPIIWRGPMIAGFVSQLYTDVCYGDIDYMFIDMPPGTGDVPLTIFQQYPIDGIIIVTSPQELVSMVVTKSINMAKMMYINTIGIVENMSYIKCPKCSEKIRVFGSNDSKKRIEKTGLKIVAELPIDPKLASLVDEGKIEDYETNEFDNLVSLIEQCK